MLFRSGKRERHNVVIDSIEQALSFPVDSKPDLVNFDAEKMLLCIKSDNKSKKEWAFQYYNAPLYLDRYEALEALSKASPDTAFDKVYADALSDKYWQLRIDAMNNFKSLPKGTISTDIKEKIIALAKGDKKADVRAAAIELLSEQYDQTKDKDTDITGIFKNAIRDSSYKVNGKGLLALSQIDPVETIEIVNTLNEKTKMSLLSTISKLFAAHGTKEHNAFFLDMYKKINSYQMYSFAEAYGTYLINQDDITIDKGLVILKEIAMTNNSWLTRLAAIYNIDNLFNLYYKREELIIEEMKINKSDHVALGKLGEEQAELKSRQDYILAILDSIKENEKDKRVLRLWAE